MEAKKRYSHVLRTTHSTEHGTRWQWAIDCDYVTIASGIEYNIYEATEAAHNAIQSYESRITLRAYEATQTTAPTMSM